MHNDYINVLNSEFHKKILKNPSYSLRSFARDLNINPGTLSAILNGQRKLPIKKAESIATSLKLQDNDTLQFIRSVELSHIDIKDLSGRSEQNIKFINETLPMYYNFVAKWEYRAILNLIEVKKLKEDETHLIATSLGLTQQKVTECLKELKALEMIATNQDKELLRVTGPVYTNQDVPSQVIKDAHINTMELAKQKLQEVDVEQREYQLMTFHCDKNKIPHAKKLIRDFTLQLTNFLETKDSHHEVQEDVFVFAAQFFPITKLD